LTERELPHPAGRVGLPVQAQRRLREKEAGPPGVSRQPARATDQVPDDRPQPALPGRAVGSRWYCAPTRGSCAIHITVRRSF